ncbi:MAG: flagellar basal body P-ring protein FlgI [Candidimonas sp.]|nr:MAG: flagellar basal body P-ring protein FlgI [Candidimonas sp.]
MAVFAVVMLAIDAAPAHAESLRDLVSIRGVRSNPLVGYGLVVGLDGSGDQVRQAPFTQQSLTNMLAQLGVTLPQGSNMQLRNVAAVMVTAQLPAFSQPGQHIDVVVSSMGNAKSLRGGTLLMTPLKGANGQVYALAQGNVVIGGEGASSGGNSAKVNQLNAGIISNGAVIEREVATTLAPGGEITLDMHEDDFGTAQNIAAAINGALGGGAQAVNGRVIRVRAPVTQVEQSRFISEMMGLNVRTAPARAVVIINARTGSVVMNRSVTLDEVAIAFGSLSVTVNQNIGVSQPGPLSNGQTVAVANPSIGIAAQEGKLKRLTHSVTLAQVVKALNSLGATPQDLLSILQSLKASGALHAELKII